MHQPGIEVRPLRQMNDHASFNEVFLDGARVPADHVVGEVGGGWAVALTTLAHERRYGAVVGERGVAGGRGRAAAEYRAEVDAHDRTYHWYPQRAGRPDLLAPEAAAAGRATEPTVRQQVSAVEAMVRTSGWTAERARAARALGRPPGAEGSLGKLAMSRVARAAAMAHAHLAGADGMLARPDAPGDGIVAEVLVSTPAQSIAGGTDEIQKTIVAERLLGLPPRAPARPRPTLPRWSPARPLRGVWRGFVARVRRSRARRPRGGVSGRPPRGGVWRGIVAGVRRSRARRPRRAEVWRRVRDRGQRTAGLSG